MADIITLSEVDFAQNTIINAGAMLRKLQSVAIEDLAKMDLATETGEPISAFNSLLVLASAFTDLADQIRAYQRRKKSQELMRLTGALPTTKPTE